MSECWRRLSFADCHFKSLNLSVNLTVFSIFGSIFIIPFRHAKQSLCLPLTALSMDEQKNGLSPLIE